MANSQQAPREYFGRGPDIVFEGGPSEHMRGVFRGWGQGPIMVTQVTGYGTIELATEIKKLGDSIAAKHGSLAVAHDWFDLESSAPESRALLQEWARDLRKRGIHKELLILVRSPLLKLSISAANLFVGGFISPFSGRSAFLGALDALRRSHRV